MHRVRFYSLIILAVTATSALAQTPAGPQPDGRRLRLGSDSLEVYIIRMGQPQRTGYLIDRLDTVRVNGETMLRRIYRTTDAVLGSSVDTLVDAWQTVPHAGPWNGWNRLGGWVSQISAALNSDGRLEVFGVGSDGNLYNIWQTAPHAGPWSGWNRLT